MNKSKSEELKKSKLKEEYPRSVELYKHYATIQFAQLTVFLLLMSNIVAFFFGKEKKFPEPWDCVVPFGLSILSFFFLIMHLSHSYMGEHFLKRLTYIEKELGYELYSKLKFGEGEPKALDQHSLRPTKVILSTLYVIGIIFWLIVCFMN